MAKMVSGGPLHVMSLQFLDMMFWAGLNFQNISNWLNSNLESFHDLVMVWLSIILLVVMVLSFKIFFKKLVTSILLDSMILEITWTILPIAILVSIAYPSIYLLCSQDFNYGMPKVSLKVMSSQWNWQSDQSEDVDHLVDSNKLDDLSNYFTPLVLPLSSCCRIFLTSSDVLHSLGVPSFGVKLDSVPGRLNAVTIEPSLLGLFPGSCYELCGSGHSAMPIFLLTC